MQMHLFEVVYQKRPEYQIVYIKNATITISLLFLARNSVDDAAVLRQELITVQTVMDEKTKEKEEELRELQTRFDILSKEKESLQSSQNNDKDELALKVSALEGEKCAAESEIAKMRELRDEEAKEKIEVEEKLKNLQENSEKVRKTQ